MVYKQSDKSLFPKKYSIAPFQVPQKMDNGHDIKDI